MTNQQNRGCWQVGTEVAAMQRMSSTITPVGSHVGCIVRERVLKPMDALLFVGHRLFVGSPPALHGVESGLSAQAPLLQFCQTIQSAAWSRREA